MAWRTGGGLLAVLGVVAAVFVVQSSFGSDDDPCGDPPVLAAATDLLVADDCIDTISFEGRTYYVTCVKMHPSRVGESFLGDGGDTYFEGASEIAGISRDRAFLLDGSPCRRDTTIAMAELPSRAKVKALERVTSAPVGQRAEVSLSTTKAGFSLMGDRMGAAALLQNATGSDVTDIELDVEFLDAEGEVLWTVEENLPFCPAQTHCWWGSSWPSARHQDAAHFDSVRVSAKAKATKRGVGRVLPLALERRADGTVRGFAPAKEGMAVLLSSAGAKSHGVMVNVKEGFGLGRRVEVGPDMFPQLGHDEALRGFMYPMKLPLGS